MNMGRKLVKIGSEVTNSLDNRKSNVYNYRGFELHREIFVAEGWRWYSNNTNHYVQERSLKNIMELIDNYLDN